jgi:hypothetical protein
MERWDIAAAGSTGSPDDALVALQGLLKGDLTQSRKSRPDQGNGDEAAAPCADRNWAAGRRS